MVYYACIDKCGHYSFMEASLKFKMVVDGPGFSKITVPLLTGGVATDWLCSLGKYAGQPITAINNPHWFAYQVHRMKGMNPASIPSGLVEALREQWLLIYKRNERDVDPAYLDRLDPSVPFDWSESPPDRGDVGLVNEKDAVDEAPSQPLFSEEEKQARDELPDWLK